MDVQLCPLCQRTPHQFPALTQYNLTCPGIHAAEGVQSFFATKLAQARHVHAQYGLTAANSPPLVKSIMARQGEAVKRFGDPQRSEVTPGQLLDDVQERLPAVTAKVGRAMLEPDHTFDVDIPHLQVLRSLTPSLPQGAPPSEISKGLPLSTVSKDRSDDFMLYDVGDNGGLP